MWLISSLFDVLYIFALLVNQKKKLPHQVHTQIPTHGTYLREERHNFITQFRSEAWQFGSLGRGAQARRHSYTIGRQLSVQHRLRAPQFFTIYPREESGTGVYAAHIKATCAVIGLHYIHPP